MKKNLKDKTGGSHSASSYAEGGILLKYSAFWLILAVVLVYAKTLSLTGLTHLDDTIFIFDKQEFNKHFSNIIRAFQIGCFNEKDIYYRPLFLVSFILEYPIAGHSFKLYHLINLVFHGANVLLLYSLLKRINIAVDAAFVMSLIYAVHPVLTMAVAWIPGYNDLLLTFFTFCFLLTVIRYSEHQTATYFILQLFLYLLCLFTKETAVFIPPVAVLFFYCWKKESLRQKKYYFLFASWSSSIAIWYIMRYQILPDAARNVFNPAFFENVWLRVPGLLQYLGKIFLPFNLSVFPTVEETSYVFGIISFVLLTSIIFLNKQRDNKMVLLGASWFVLFILPFFFVPKGINNQLFEHRLYLPIVGVFILLSQSLLFKFVTPAKRMMQVGFLVAIVFSVLTIKYINRFEDQITFWGGAVKDSPHSSYANKMYGIKLAERKKNAEAVPYIKRAYEIDSTERYVNLYLARLIYLPADSLKEAERCLLNETRLNPNYGDTYFELAHLYFMMNHLQSAKANLIKFLSFRPKEEPSNTNLLRLYLDLKEYENARKQMDHMEEMDLRVNPGIKATVDAALQKPI